MKNANIATTKNQLSRLLRQVKRGETIVITERNKPIAQLAPIRSTNEVFAKLAAEGMIRLPEAGPLDVEEFLAMPTANVVSRRSLVAAVLEDREQSR